MKRWHQSFLRRRRARVPSAAASSAKYVEDASRASEAFLAPKMHFTKMHIRTERTRVEGMKRRVEARMELQIVSKLQGNAKVLI